MVLHGDAGDHCLWEWSQKKFRRCAPSMQWCTGETMHACSILPTVLMHVCASSFPTNLQGYIRRCRSTSQRGSCFGISHLQVQKHIQERSPSSQTLDRTRSGLSTSKTELHARRLGNQPPMTPSGSKSPLGAPFPWRSQLVKCHIALFPVSEMYAVLRRGALFDRGLTLASWAEMCKDGTTEWAQRPSSVSPPPSRWWPGSPGDRGTQPCT
jgi:hypothetical protein